MIYGWRRFLVFSGGVDEVGMWILEYAKMITPVVASAGENATGDQRMSVMPESGIFQICEL